MYKPLSFRPSSQKQKEKRVFLDAERHCSVFLAYTNADDHF